MTSVERLVHMANQIAANLMHEVDPAAETAHHIALYWDPRMKRMIGDYEGAGLSPVAGAAIAALSLR